jgi:hypothetical protein
MARTTLAASTLNPKLNSLEMTIGEGKSGPPFGDRPKNDEGHGLVGEVLSHQRPDAHASISHDDPHDAAGKRPHELTYGQFAKTQASGQQGLLDDRERRKNRPDGIPAQDRRQSWLAVEGREGSGKPKGEKGKRDADEKVGPKRRILMRLFDRVALNESRGETLIGEGLHGHHIDGGQGDQAESRWVDQASENQKDDSRDAAQRPCRARGPKGAQYCLALHRQGPGS